MVRSFRIGWRFILDGFMVIGLLCTSAGQLALHFRKFLWPNKEFAGFGRCASGQVVKTVAVQKISMHCTSSTKIHLKSKFVIYQR